MVEAGGSALDSGVGVVDGRNQACQVRSSRTEPFRWDDGAETRG